MATTKEVYREGKQLISADKNKEALESFLSSMLKISKRGFQGKHRACQRVQSYWRQEQGNKTLGDCIEKQAKNY